MPIAQQKTQKGFGLLELIITLAIVAVLTSMATIALQQRLRAQQLHTAQADTLVALRFARITAIHQHRKVLFCLSSDGRHCIKEKTQRKQGWLVAYEGHGSIQSTLLLSLIHI